MLLFIPAYDHTNHSKLGTAITLTLPTVFASIAEDSTEVLTETDATQVAQTSNTNADIMV